MTIYEFVRKYYKAWPDGHYFDRQTLKSFGERLSETRVLKGTAMIKTADGTTHECYVLSRMQRNYPGGPRRSYAYFEIETMRNVFPAE